MKILKTSILCLTLAFAFSCTNDLDKEVILQSTVDITGTIEASTTVAAPNFPIGFTVNLPVSFDKTAIVTVQAQGADYLTTTAQVTIPAGATVGTGTISMPALALINNFNAVQDHVDVEIQGVALYDEVTVDGMTTLVVDTSDNTVLGSNAEQITYYERVQWPYGAGVVAGRMTALFDWTNSAGNDLDMLMFNADTFANVESAASGSRWETDIFNDTHPDGDYFIAVDAWAVADADIDWRLFFVQPNQTEIVIFEGTFTGLTVGTAANALIFPVVNFTKSTDASGNVSYTYSQP